MKKFFSILLTLAMLLNVGIVAMAEEETVFTLDFETAMDITKSGKNNSITYDDVTLTNNKNSSNYYSNIIEYSAGTGVNGSQSLKLQAPGYGYANVSYNVSNLEVGRIYRFSADVKLDETATKAKATNMSTITEGVYYVNRDESGNVDSLVNRCGVTVTATTGGVKGITLNSNDYTTIEKEFYVSADAPATVKFTLSGLGSNANNNVYYYVDNVSLVKTDDYVGNIQCVDAITIPTEGNPAEEEEYSLTGTGVATAEEIVKIGEYEGVDVANGKVTVTSAAQPGTLTIGIKKNLYTAADTYTETVIVQKEIKLEVCEAAKKNLIAGGTFEDETYETAIEEQAWEHATATAVELDDAYCGEKVLKVDLGDPYYPTTFKTTLEKGGVYKFTAYVMFEERKTYSNTTIGLTAVTSNVVLNEVSHDRYNGIWAFKEDGTKYDAGYNWSVNGVKINKGEWTKLERYIYVSDEVESDSVTTYIGVNNEHGSFTYYLDDVSLVKIGNLAGVNSIVIPADNTSATYTFTRAVEGDYTVALKTAPTGADFNGSALEVDNTASAGIVNVQVKLGSQVIADKEVALFDESGVVVAGLSPSTSGNTTFKVFVNKTKSVAKPVMIRANYGTTEVFNSIETTRTKDLDDCWRGCVTNKLKSGELNKYMLWDGIGTMKPLMNVREVTFVSES